MKIAESVKYQFYFYLILIAIGLISGYFFYSNQSSKVFIYMFFGIAFFIILFFYIGLHLFFNNRLNKLAQKLKLEKNYFLFDGRLKSDNRKSPWNFFNKAIGGIYYNFFVKIGYYIVFERHRRTSYDYTYIIIEPKNFYKKHNQIRDRIIDLSKTISREEKNDPNGEYQLLLYSLKLMKGNEFELDKNYKEKLKNKIIEDYNYQFEFGIFEKALVFKFFGKISDMEKLKRYLDKAIEIMKKREDYR